MPFEVYIPRTKKVEKRPRPIVKLSKTSMVLNKLAREKIPATHLELAYDPENRLIRICPTTAGNKAGLEMKKTKVYAKGFYNTFGIEAQGKFEAEYNEKENALYVKI